MTEQNGNNTAAPSGTAKVQHATSARNRGREHRRSVLPGMEEMRLSRDAINTEITRSQERRGNVRGSGLYFGKKALIEHLEDLEKQRRKLRENSDEAVTVADAIRKERSLSSPRVATLTLRFDDQAVEARVVRYVTTLNDSVSTLEELIPRLISADFGSRCDRLMAVGINEITSKVDACMEDVKRYYTQYAITLPRMEDGKKIEIAGCAYEYAALRRPVIFDVYSPYVKKWLQQAKRIDFISFLLSVLTYETSLEQKTVRSTVYELTRLLKDYVRIIVNQRRLAFAELRSKRTREEEKTQERVFSDDTVSTDEAAEQNA